VMYNQYENIFSGSSTVDEAFEAMEKESNALLDRFNASMN
jgi:sn-glycerol 3-phosphate transport system substrate-binding protein